jgi:hypothetical protein
MKEVDMANQYNIVFPPMEDGKIEQENCPRTCKLWLLQCFQGLRSHKQPATEETCRAPEP